MASACMPSCMNLHANVVNFAQNYLVGRHLGSMCRRSNGVQELIVVTILVAVQASLKMPRVTSGDELRTALNRLGAVRTEQVRSGIPEPAKVSSPAIKWDLLSSCQRLHNLIHKHAVL